MARQRGSTMFEVLTVLTLLAILGAVAVPSAVGVRRKLAAGAGAGTLELVLRGAQAHAQARLCAVRVAVGAGGDFAVTEVLEGRERLVGSGELHAATVSNYPDATVEFGPQGWPRSPGSATLRAGRFVVGGAAAGHTVIIQLSGCVRCV